MYVPTYIIQKPLKVNVVKQLHYFKNFIILFRLCLVISSVHDIDKKLNANTEIAEKHYYFNYNN